MSNTQNVLEINFVMKCLGNTGVADFGAGHHWTGSATATAQKYGERYHAQTRSSQLAAGRFGHWIYCNFGLAGFFRIRSFQAHSCGVLGSDSLTRQRGSGDETDEGQESGTRQPGTSAGKAAARSRNAKSLQIRLYLWRSGLIWRSGSFSNSRSNTRSSACQSNHVMTTTDGVRVSNIPMRKNRMRPPTHPGTPNLFPAK